MKGSVLFSSVGIENTGKYYCAKSEENAIQMQNLSQRGLLHAMFWVVGKEALHCIGKAMVEWIGWNSRAHSDMRSPHMVLLTASNIFGKISLE